MERPYLGIACTSLAIVRFILCVALAIGAFRESTFDKLAVQYAWLMDTVLILSACVDVIIAVSLCYFLLNRRDTQLGRQDVIYHYAEQSSTSIAFLELRKS
jgi:cytochrome c oxidase subunit IV